MKRWDLPKRLPETLPSNPFLPNRPATSRPPPIAAQPCRKATRLSLFEPGSREGVRKTNHLQIPYGGLAVVSAKYVHG